MVRCDICEAVIDASNWLSVFACMYCERMVCFGCSSVKLANDCSVEDVECDICIGLPNPGELYEEVQS